MRGLTLCILVVCAFYGCVRLAADNHANRSNPGLGETVPQSPLENYNSPPPRRIPSKPAPSAVPSSELPPQDQIVYM